MSKYHDKTLELLGVKTLCDRFDARTLREWAIRNNVILPAAFLEWAELNGQQILAKYSNNDYFKFNEPTILTMPQGLRGIEFHYENQGNFSKIVLLDSGDDPPVFFSWEESPWVIHTESFSDCVFAQIFDYQYCPASAPDPDCQEIGYININLKTDRCLSILRDRFQEEVSTRYLIGNSEYRDYRFLKSLKKRITVSVSNLDEDYRANIQIACQKQELAVALEAELLNVLDIVPPVFNSVTWAINSLGTQIDREWGVVILFQRKNSYWWSIEGIY